MITGTRITDDALRTLAMLPRLERLELHHHRITDAGLAHLAASKGLRHLAVSGAPGPTPTAIRALTRAIPGLRVHVG